MRTFNAMTAGPSRQWRYWRRIECPVWLFLLCAAALGSCDEDDPFVDDYSAVNGDDQGENGSNQGEGDGGQAESDNDENEHGGEQKGSYIKIVDARESKLFMATEAGAQDRFVDILVEISNGEDAKQNMPFHFALFSLETHLGKLHLVSQYVVQHSEHCSSDTLMLPGANTQCRIVFEVPLDENIVQLRYENEFGTELTAPVELETCTWCDNECVLDLTNNPEHCGRCFAQISSNQECKDGQFVCVNAGETLCGESCIDLMTDGNHCGQCNRAVGPSQKCVDGEIACRQKQQKLCGNICRDIQNNEKHCGDCNHVCPDNTYCSLKKCVYQVDSYDRISCKEKCESLGYTCRRAAAEYNNSSVYGCNPSNLLCNQVPQQQRPDGCVFYRLGCTCVLP